MLDVFSRSRSAAYVIALALVAIALLLRFVLAGVLVGSSGLLFAPAILIAAIMGGLLPGLFATVLALPAVVYFAWAGHLSTENTVVGSLLFAIVGGTIAWLGGLLHQSRARWLATRKTL